MPLVLIVVSQQGCHKRKLNGYQVVCSDKQSLQAAALQAVGLQRQPRAAMPTVLQQAVQGTGAALSTAHKLMPESCDA